MKDKLKNLCGSIPFFKERASHRVIAMVVAIALVFGAFSCMTIMSARAEDEIVPDEEIFALEEEPIEEEPIEEEPIEEEPIEEEPVVSDADALGEPIADPVLPVTGDPAPPFTDTTPQIVVTVDGDFDFYINQGTVSGKSIYVDCGDGEYVALPNNGDNTVTADGSVKFYCDAPITDFNASESAATAVDVSNAYALETLYLDDSSVASLNCSGCDSLVEVTANNAPLTSADFSGCDSLDYLELMGTNLTSLDVSSCPVLSSLDCSDSADLSSLTVNDDIMFLYAGYCDLSELDLSNTTALDTLWLDGNQLQDLDCSGMSELWFLSVADNCLESIDVSGCDGLAYLYLNDNLLTFETLPEDAGYDDYFYANQATIELPTELDVNSEVLDLSSQASVGDTDSEFIFFDENGDEVTPVSTDGGIIEFDPADIGKTVYAFIVNEALPGDDEAHGDESDLFYDDGFFYILTTDMLLNGKFTVTFTDEDGNIYSEQEVEYGEAAVAPVDPEKEGYDFVEWVGDFSNITEDTDIIAKFEPKKYTVVFQDWDGTELKRETVAYLQSATAPADPTREGYKFIGWKSTFGVLPEKDAPIEPSIPLLPSRTTVGRQTASGKADYKCVTDNLIVIAQYQEIKASTGGNGTGENTLGIIIAINVLALAAGAAFVVLRKKNALEK